MARTTGAHRAAAELAKNAADIEAAAETAKQDASNFEREGRGGSSGTGSPNRRTRSSDGAGLPRSSDGAGLPAPFRQISTAEQKAARNALVASKRKAKRQKAGNHPDKDREKDAEFDIALEAVDSGSGSEQEQDGESYRFSTASIL